MLVDKESGEIFLYQPIGADFFGDGITAEAVINALGKLDGKRATVRINSPGGIADEGIAIYNALRRYAPGVDTVVDAVAASAASVVALAGDSRTTATGARWMIHRAMTMAVGNVSDMEKAGETLAKYDQSIVEIYADHMVDVTPEAILGLMSAETWYTGEEAMAAGLSTGKASTEAVTPNVANWFSNAPKALYDNAFNTVAKPKYPVRRQAAEIRNRALAPSGWGDCGRPETGDHR